MIILASNSPRRKELLELGGWSFIVRPADVDESPISGETPEAYVWRLAEQKARSIASDPTLSLADDDLIVAADTTVVEKGMILGKPQDAGQAEWMLRRLRGKVHQVHTAVAVFSLHDGRLLSTVATTHVRMRAYSGSEMKAYVASGDPLDKAGGYAIQHSGFRPVENLQGCFANVMGLPVCQLSRLLAEFGAFAGNSTVQACQQALAGPCQLSEQMLRDWIRWENER